MENYTSYILPAAFIAFLIFRFLKFQAVRAKIPALLKQGAVIVDVRSPGEYAQGHVPGSLNIPLGEVDKTSDKLDRDKPVIVCCASGTRSAMAASLLKKQGFSSVYNAGPWSNAFVKS